MVWWLISNSVPQCRCITVCLAFHLLKNILIASKFLQLWIHLIEIFLCMFFHGHVFSTHGYIPRRTIPGSFERVCSILWETVFQSGYNILHTYQQWRWGLMLHILTSISYYQCFEFYHFTKCVILSHGFNSQFPNGIWCWLFFHITICHSYSFFGESAQNFVIFFLIVKF